MSNEKLNIWDTDISSMGEIRIRVDEETLAELKKGKKLGGFLSYNDEIKYILKKHPITAPTFEEGGDKR